MQGEGWGGSRTANRQARRETRSRSRSDQGVGLIISQSDYVLADRGRSELDAVCVIEGLPYGGPGELHSAGVLLVVGARAFATHALQREEGGGRFRLSRRHWTMSASAAR